MNQAPQIRELEQTDGTKQHQKLITVFNTECDREEEEWADITRAEYQSLYQPHDEPPPAEPVGKTGNVGVGQSSSSHHTTQYSANGTNLTGQEWNDRKRKYGKQANRFDKHRRFMQQSARYCTATAVNVWCSLWDEERDGLVQKLSEQTIAKRLGKATRTIERAIAELVEKGYARVEKKGGLGKGASWYSLHATPCK